MSGDLERLVLGTAALGDDAVTPRLCDRFYEAGGRALDLANVYGGGPGVSERAIGRWLRTGGDGVTLYVKGCHPPNCSPSLVRAEVDEARAALGLDALDVFILHRDDTTLEVAEFGAALLAEVERGSIGSFGVSNWTLARYEALAAELGGDARHLTAFSNQFSLAEMVAPPWPDCLSMTTAEIASLERDGVTALAWASLAEGYFAGLESPSWASTRNEARRGRARELAGERGTTPIVVALAYVLRQASPVLAVVGPRSEAHLDELIGAAALPLSPAELAWLRGE
jgi:aryl-alcohol dehydrogenase-like predicted oxidoreductase